VGAILTQNTGWANVEKALRNLHQASVLAPRRLAGLSQEHLHSLLQPSGYFRQKARTLSTFLEYLGTRYRHSLQRMFRTPTAQLHDELLRLRGIGKETADSILLYAGDRPVFVIDAYTRRILLRHGLAAPDATYEALQGLFLSQLPRRAKLFNEYHALLVAVGKHYCHRRQPDCSQCPLGPELGGNHASA
jgi:endonuclease-3 related protein